MKLQGSCQWMRCILLTLEDSTCEFHSTTTVVHSYVVRVQKQYIAKLMHAFCLIYVNSDGTTDITRTVHWGKPTDFQRYGMAGMGSY